MVGASKPSSDQPFTSVTNDETKSSASKNLQHPFENMIFNKKITYISATECEIEFPFPPPFWKFRNDKLESGDDTEDLISAQVRNLSKEPLSTLCPNSQNDKISNQCGPVHSKDQHNSLLVPDIDIRYTCTHT
jgi:hypothetical protein